MYFLHILKTIVAAIVLFALACSVAMAQATSVSIPYGDWIVASLPVLSFIVLVLVIFGLGYALKFLPPWAQALITPALEKEAIVWASRALNWGVQAIAGAAKGKELDIPVGNAVIAKAAQDFIDSAPKAVVDRLGGIEGVKKYLLKQAEDHGVILATDSNAKDILNSPEVKAVTGSP